MGLLPFNAVGEPGAEGYTETVSGWLKVYHKEDDPGKGCARLPDGFLKPACRELRSADLGREGLLQGKRDS